ncbi:EAL domain-containing protein [Sulfurimonas lithotrophica]|uniref:EAL domain-containing protein n=1 Tax=Sulfurimonas lithotrophica TaxID=2590022 RepID=A0A5P8NY00_9BACT|nr:EAL domain-containing protein [Sulfurimonas lithotrophica]QFR48315.1 EAL domain-containing protein [Sulfurimonas lithotrophica]
MRTKNASFLVLFLKVMIPVCIVIFSFSFFLLQKATAEKKETIYESTLMLSHMISNVAKFDREFSLEDAFERDAQQATLYQIKQTFEKFNNIQKSQFEYYIAEKSDKKIKFIACSTDNKPNEIILNKYNVKTPIIEVFSGKNSVDILYNHEHKKVFAAYIKIPESNWALVVEESYSEHIKPFKESAVYMSVIILFILSIIYFILKYYEQKNMQLINETEHRYKNLLESTHNWIWEVDTEGKYTYVSKQVEEILGYKAQEIIGKSPFDLMPKDEALRIKRAFKKIIENEQEIINIENINIHKNGHEVVLLTNGTPFFNATGQLLGYRGVDRDITDEKNKQKEIEHLAYYDLLTGLANRKTISIRIDEEISYTQRNEIVSALIYMDLDGFKFINDSLGHNHGDKVLQIVAQRLKECIRKFDVASRVGGDEFIVLVRGKDKDYKKCQIVLKGLIHRIINAVNMPIDIENGVNHIGVSIGVAFIPKDGDNANDIIKRADSAMYKAKQMGKNRAVFYDKYLQEEADKHIEIKNELVNAFNNDEFVIYYQSQHDVDTAEVRGYEALIRWKHNTKGILMPYEFMPYVEKFGLSLELDKYVCEKIYEHFYKLRQDDSINISINISATSFEDPEFIAYVEEKVKNNDVRTNQVTLEITEDTLIKNLDASFINRIRALGFRVSIDDFGTGYSSLSYLTKIDFDEIKLDMTFIHAIQNSKKDEEICKLILHMCNELGANVVAEGIETREQLEFVKKEGATIIQGYFYSKPLPYEEIFS